jgi:2-polyprenyl-3-methyl-5-hydroxy-6-metoxy-1,4-benzoquinol methylase
MAQQAGLDLVSMTGVTYKPWAQTWQLAPYTTAINYMMLFKKAGAA